MTTTGADDAAGTGPRSLRASAGTTGAAAWWELRCFEVVGGWVATVEDPAVKVHLAAAARHHAWRGEVLVQRLPRLREVDPAELLAPPGASAVAAVAAAAATTGTGERLAVHQRVLLPLLLGRHRRNLDGASVVADASLVRWLGKVLDDLVEDLAAGEALLRPLLADVGSVERTSAACLAVERVRAG